MTKITISEEEHQAELERLTIYTNLALTLLKKGGEQQIKSLIPHPVLRDEYNRLFHQNETKK